MFDDILGKKKKKDKPKRKVLINLKDKKYDSFDELKRKILESVRDVNRRI